MLHTGGTLGMAGGRPSALRPAPFVRTLRERVPELAELADVRLEVFSNLDSSEMQPESWVQLARVLARRLPDFDGAVVTHGTDTLAYTASALSFLLPGLDRPVVLTGSQRPLKEVRTDARLNLIDAVTSALRGPPEVTVCFDSKLYRGQPDAEGGGGGLRRVRESELPPARDARGDGALREGTRRRGGCGWWTGSTRGCSSSRSYPGLDPALPLALLGQMRGLVVEAYGAGNVPVDEAGGRSLRPRLRGGAAPGGGGGGGEPGAAKRGGPLALRGRCRQRCRKGAIGGGDMTSVAALTKLMHVLGVHRSMTAIRRAMERVVVGERS